MSTEQPQENIEPQVEAEQVDQVEENTAEVTSEEVDVAQLIAELSKAQATVVEQKDSVLRAKADADNARRRAAQDVEKAHKFGLEKYATELLQVIDNLERALQFADKENEALKPIIEGIEMTLQSFVSANEKFGLIALDPQGETFNPEKHQAMSMQESADVAPNTVIAVMQKGYELNGRVVRPAMVMVSRAPAESVDTQA